jgi:hypothetical protein
MHTYVQTVQSSTCVQVQSSPLKASTTNLNLIAPHMGHNTRSVPAAGGVPCCGGSGAWVPRRSAARPTTSAASAASACRVHRALLGCHQVSLFRFLALGLVLACLGLPERSQRRSTNAQLATSCRSFTRSLSPLSLSLVHFHFL